MAAVLATDRIRRRSLWMARRVWWVPIGDDVDRAIVKARANGTTIADVHVVTEGWEGRNRRRGWSGCRACAPCGL